jgi:uncharacterized repeat protein (TIGR03803 family)
MGTIGFGKAACVIAAFCVATAIASPAQTFTTLLSFDLADGFDPAGSLIQGANGNLYGTTYSGGTSGNCGPDGCGTIFEITPQGRLKTLHSFDATDGTGPTAGLVQGANGSFYGTTSEGGAKGWGTVFKITASGELTTLHSFCSQSSCADGRDSAGSLVQGANGNLYGTTREGGNVGGINGCADSNGCGTVFEVTAAGNLTTIYSFCSQPGCSDGVNPTGALVLGNDGNLYGTTFFGGSFASAECDFGCGTVFKISSTAKLTTLYEFCSQPGCSDGIGPSAALVLGAEGNFYGTTYWGGNFASPQCPDGCGTVFQMTPAGRLTTLYTFCSQTNCTDGSNPAAGVVQGTDGNFYGVTYSGGINGNPTHCSQDSCGTVFEISPTGQFATLYSFCSQTNCIDGANSQAALTQATNGVFYGVAVQGGSSSACQPGCGTIFSLSMGFGPFVETNPAFGKVGRVVGILGSNLTGTTAVTFNGTPATFAVVSSTLIKATVPSGATTGTIQVTTPTGTLSSNVAFQIR